MRRAPPIARATSWVLRSPVRSSLVVGSAGFAVALLASICRGGVPAPMVHDEFSYLLAADTYAHGRLANPTPALWEHFETFHVLMVPTYASKYPPAQGMALAVGQVLTGQPIVGVWLGYAFMCAALTWMLLAWVRPRWAVWGGLFACLWLVGYQAGSEPERAYWATSYWGGALAAAGGALLLGGVRRILAQPRVLPSVLTAVGLGILANSRPAEGLYVALLPCGVLVAWLGLSRRAHLMTRLSQVAVPVAVVLAAVGSFMLHYNARVTGTPWKMPWVAYEEAYGTTRPFVWQPPRPTPQYRYEVMHQYYTTPGDLNPPRPTSVRSWLEGSVDRLTGVRAFYLPFYAAVLLLMLPWVLADRWAILALGSVSCLVLGLAVENWTFPHYAAPAVGPLVILFVLGARRLSLLRTRRARPGAGIVRIVFACAGVWALVSAAASLNARQTHQPDWSEQRQALVRDLTLRGGRNLVIVRYGPEHDYHYEWVYNGADIETAPVVFARSQGPGPDARLRAHFAGARPWALDIDDDDGPFVLRPLTP